MTRIGFACSTVRAAYWFGGNQLRISSQSGDTPLNLGARAIHEAKGVTAGTSTAHLQCWSGEAAEGRAGSHRLPNGVLAP